MDKNEDIINIKHSRLASNAAIKRKDVTGVSSYWLPDFIQIAGDGSHTIGRVKIEKDWKQMFSHSSPVFERLPEEIIIAESGDIAWEKGVWAYKEERFFGNYSAMWRKLNGRWLTQCELYVSLH
ncbi:ketosteroid isomerase-like protein [Pedobacter sp. CAN_A7]|uniref:YybH family protein n=1 Tax=Pedobacter sp. CAN_A7 TaxID=2787722 RepID=UPI0018C9FE6C